MPAAHLNQPPTNTNKCMTLWHYDREIFCCCVLDDEIKSNSNWVFATWSSNKFWSGVPLCSHHKCDHLWSFLCCQLLLNFFHHQVSKPSSNCNKLSPLHYNHCPVCDLNKKWFRNDYTTIWANLLLFWVMWTTCLKVVGLDSWFLWNLGRKLSSLCTSWLLHSFMSLQRSLDVSDVHTDHAVDLPHIMICCTGDKLIGIGRSCCGPTSHHLQHWRQAHQYNFFYLWTVINVTQKLSLFSWCN